MLMNSIVLNSNNNNSIMMMMNQANSNGLVTHTNGWMPSCQQGIESNNYFTSLLLSNDKISLDEVQINSPLFLKLDIEDLLQTLQAMNTQQEEQLLPTTPSSTLNTSTDM